MSTNFKRKADYSRRGCLDCKKSHLKCDEGLPCCQRCQKRKTVCTYETKFVLENGRVAKYEPQGSSDSSVGNEKRRRTSSIKISPKAADPTIDKISSADRKLSEVSNTDIKNFSGDSQSVSPTKGHDLHKDSVDLKFNDLVVSPISNITNVNAENLELSLSPMSFTFRSPKNGQVSIHDIVYVVPGDLDSLRKIEVDDKNMDHLHHDQYHPNLHLFEIPWDGGPLICFIDLIERHDPVGEFPNGDISLNDHSLLDFVWSLARISKYFLNFAMYPEDMFELFLDLCLKLGSVNPIFQSVMTYNCSLVMQRLYKHADKPELAKIWDRHIRIPAFRQCIDTLKEKIENSKKFSEIVGLSFAVVIIFSGNSSDENWRTHLNGSFQLLIKASKLKHLANRNDEIDQLALKLYDVVSEWFYHTEFLSQVSSLKGGDMRRINPLNVQIGVSFKNEFAITSNGINLMCGHCIQLTKLMNKIYNCLVSFRDKGINLSGLNFVKSILTSDLPEHIDHEIKVNGYELLFELKELMSTYKYKRLKLDDFKTDLSMKYCNLLYMYGLKLYLMFFFIGKRDATDIEDLLRDILDLLYSMPYVSSVSLVCHWIIYLSAQISLLISDFKLYNNFVAVLELFRANGMNAASIDILENLKKIFLEKDYDQLTKTENDFVIF